MDDNVISSIESNLGEVGKSLNKKNELYPNPKLLISILNWRIWQSPATVGSKVNEMTN